MNVVKLYDTFFTSDSHFWHKRIQEFCPDTRKGNNVDEMNELMIQAWNDRVKPGDKIYHLGDFSFGTAGQTEYLLSRLNGDIYFIMGNHDKVIEKNAHLRSRFMWIRDYAKIRIGDKSIMLMHFPIESWDKRGHNSWHFHGHLHGDSHRECTILPNRLDVGVDTRKECDMAPYHFDELAEIIKNGGH